VTRGSNNTFRNIYRWPAILAALSSFGLISALIGDGIWDGLSWIALAIPLAVMGWFASRGRSWNIQARRSMRPLIRR
jgi:hypothetical protein